MALGTVAAAESDYSSSASSSERMWAELVLGAPRVARPVVVVRRAVPCKGSLRRVSSWVVRRELQSACNFWILRTFTNSAHGKRSSFSQNSSKWDPFFENACFSLIFCEFVRFLLIFIELFGKPTNYTHGERASFSQISQKLHPFSENVCFSWKLIEFVRVSWAFSEFVPFVYESLRFCWNLVNYL